MDLITITPLQRENENIEEIPGDSSTLMVESLTGITWNNIRMTTDQWREWCTLLAGKPEQVLFCMFGTQ